MADAGTDSSEEIVVSNRGYAIAPGLEVLAVVENHLIGAGIGFLLRQELATAARTYVLARAELGQLESMEEDQTFDLMVLELGIFESVSQFERLTKRFADVPLVLIQTSPGPTWLQSKASLPARAKVIESSSSLEHYLRTFSEVAGLATMAVRPTSRDQVETGKNAVISEGFSMRLTSRQREVFKLMIKGFSNKEIAQNLGLSPGTVKLHVSALLKALNFRSRAQVQAAAHGSLATEVSH